MTVELMHVIITILGCVAVFIFAIDMMSEGLQKAAGDRIKRIIEMCTANYLVAVLAGFLMSAIFQSSSACIVFIIGFVNARLMRLPEAMCVIFGANIGTTLTAHIVAFNVGVYGWAVVLIGFIIMAFIKGNEHIKNIGEIVFAAGLVFASLNIMTATMEKLLESQLFIDTIQNGTDSGWLVMVLGMCATALVQSSSVVVAVVQQFAEVMSTNGTVAILAFFPLIVGCNIGTTVTGLLASVKSSTNGKRVAVFHLMFNVFTSIVWLIIITILVKYHVEIPMFTDNDDVAKALANIHTIFNVTGVILLFPFVGKIAVLLKKLVRSKDETLEGIEFLYIQKQRKTQPIIANMMCIQELMRCSKMVVEILYESKKYFVTGNEKHLNNAEERYKTVCTLVDEIMVYIAENLTYEGYSQNRRYHVQILYIIADEIKSMAKNCLSICQLTKTQMEEYIEFAEEDERNIVACFDKINKLIIQSFSAVEEDDMNMAQKNQKNKEELDELISSFRIDNLERVKENDDDSSGLIIFSDILDNIERIASNCENVSDVVLKTKKV